MNVRDFEYLVELSKAGSISRASKALYISQPALSKFIQKMEADAGTPLFQHVGRRLVPTYAGEQCIQTATEILYLHNKMLNTLADIAHKKSGRIKLGLPLSRSDYFIAKILPLFYQRFPNTCVNVYEDSGNVLLKMLLLGELDMIFGNMPEEHEELFYETISEEEMVLAAPETFDLQRLGFRQAPYRYPCLLPEHWKDLPFLMLDADQISRAYADQYLKEAHITPNTILTVRNLGLVMFSVQQGLGVTICPSMPILKQGETHKVCYFSLPNEVGPVVRQISVTYRKDAYLSVAEKVLIEIIKEHFNNN